MKQVAYWTFCVGTVLLLSGQQPINQDQGFGVVVPSEITVSGIGSSATLSPIIPVKPKGCNLIVSFSSWQGRFPPTIQDQALLDLINNSRTSVGAAPLTWHSGLAKGAIDHGGWCGSCSGGSAADETDPNNFQQLCYCGFSNIYNDLTYNDCNCNPPHVLAQEFVTTGPSNNPAAVQAPLNCPPLAFPGCTPTANCEDWDIPGRFQQALPKITFADMGIIIGQQKGILDQPGDAGSFFYSGIQGNLFARNIVNNPFFTTFGCSFDPRVGVWVLVFGQSVSPNG